MVIDFHVHCFTDGLAPKAVAELSERCGIPPLTDGTIAGIKKSMHRAGVDKSVVLNIATKPSQTVKINDWAASVQDEEIVSFGSIHPDNADYREELKRIKKLGLKGIKFHPDYQHFFVDDAGMFKIYEAAFEQDLIMVFHCGVDIGLEAPYHCTPDRLLSVIKAFPQGKIVAAHMGSFSMWDEVEHFLVGQEVYLDTSYSLGWIPGAQAKRIIRDHGYEKILYATDSPWTDQGSEITKLKELGLGTKVEEAILGKNAENLLKI